MHSQKRCVEHNPICTTCGEQASGRPRCSTIRLRSADTEDLAEHAPFRGFHQLLLCPSIQKITKVAPQHCAQARAQSYQIHLIAQMLTRPVSELVSTSRTHSHTGSTPPIGQMPAKKRRAKTSDIAHTE